MYRKDKLYGLAGVNGQNKKVGPKYMEYTSSYSGLGKWKTRMTRKA
jgi:hypothetical protein